MASMWILVASLVLSLIPADAENGHIGVCYKGLGKNVPPEKETVSLIKKYNIPNIRLYGPEIGFLEGLRGKKGSSRTVILGTTTDDIRSLGTNASAAALWTKNNVRPYVDNIKYVAVGDQVMPGDPNAQYIAPAINNLHNALKGNYTKTDIMVSTVVNWSVLTDTDPPSKSSFGVHAPHFGPIVKLLKSIGSPLFVNVYPHLSVIRDRAKYPLDYALFKGTKVVTDSGNGLQYFNLFDAQVDSFYAAMEKLGGNGVRVVVSETGWPYLSQGPGPADVATPENAAAYYSNLKSHAIEGTPRTLADPIETYLFEMYDEANSDTKFGLFTPDPSTHKMKGKYGIEKYKTCLRMSC